MTWEDSPKAGAFVASLLRKSGIPLQLEVARICKDFAALNPQLIRNIGRLVYSTDEDPLNYREVDHVLNLTRSFSFKVGFYDELILRVLIECKSREDVQHFVFDEDVELFKEPLPIASILAHTPFIRSLRSRTKPIEAHAEIVGVKIDQGQTPRSLEGENVVYNAAGSLYDFIARDIKQSSMDADRKNLVQGLEKSGITDKLGNPTWSSEAKTDELNAEDLNAFVSVVDDSFVDFSVTAYLPIVCVNGRLFRASLGDDSKMDYGEIDYCYCVVRKHGWPGPLRRYLNNSRAEAVVILTNPVGLPKALDMAQRWFERLHKSISAADEAAQVCAAIQAAYHQSGRGDAVQSRGYRSDWGLS